MDRQEIEVPQERYEAMALKLARDIVFNDDDLDHDALVQLLKNAQETRGISTREKEFHKLEALTYLLDGIEAHEKANLFHNGAWQATLIRWASQHSPSPILPEDLTRPEVADAFADFQFKKSILHAEQKALDAYRKLLNIQANTPIQLRENIQIHPVDINVLLLDLRVRIAERIERDEERHVVLQELDEELIDLIEQLPKYENGKPNGKRLELQEMYLIRRLIHATGTGHLASINHGSLRQDLRADLGTVDVTLTAAGDVFNVQLKTFQFEVAAKGRARQQEIVDEAESKLTGSSTHLFILTTEAIQGAYEAAVRQKDQKNLRLVDKYEALRPVLDGLPPAKRQRLLTLIGLTEDDLVHEQNEYQKRQEARQQQEEEMRTRKETEKRELEEAAKRIQAENIAREPTEEELFEAEQQRAARAEQARLMHEREAALEALQRQAATSATAQEKLKSLQGKLKEAAQREAAQREEAARQAAEAALKAARAAARQAKQVAAEKERMEAGDWPPDALVKLSNPLLLIKLGLLSESWNNTPPLLLKAKQEFIELFAARPKSNPSAAVTEKSKPNTLFKFAFPTRQSLEAPTDEDIQRWQELAIKK